MSNQPLHFDLAASKPVDDHDLCDLSYKQKMRIGKSRSLRTSETPRRSPRLAHLKKSNGSTESGLRQRPGVLELSEASTIDRVEHRGAQVSLLYKKPHTVLEGDRQHIIGMLGLVLVKTYKCFLTPHTAVDLIYLFFRFLISRLQETQTNTR